MFSKQTFSYYIGDLELFYVDSEDLYRILLKLILDMEYNSAVL